MSVVRLPGIPRPVEERIRSLSVVDAAGCWVWHGTRDEKGYGRMTVDRKQGALAHRVSYRTFRGVIPSGLQLDHLCRNRACVNPEHLEPVDGWENMRRGEPVQRTHCTNGHPRNATNIRHAIDEKGHRRQWCRPCQLASQKRYQSRKRAA